jgi:predicted nucleic acid-binding protein
MFLLDTNVISELRKARPHGAVLTWFREIDPAQLRLSAMVIGEIQAGIELTRQQHPDKASELEIWLTGVGKTYEIVPMDGPICREWALLMDRKSRVLIEDAFIAATARVRGFIVVTRNLSDFQGFKVRLFDPFTGTVVDAS